MITNQQQLSAGAGEAHTALAQMGLWTLEVTMH